MAVRFLWFLPAHPRPLPKFVAFAIFVFLLLGLPPLGGGGGFPPFLVSFPIPSFLLLCVTTNAGCLSLWFTFVSSFLFGCSGFVFCALEVWGGSPVLFGFCESDGGTPMFVSSSLRGVSSLFFPLLSGSLAVRSSPCIKFLLRCPVLLSLHLRLLHSSVRPSPSGLCRRMSESSSSASCICASSPSSVLLSA